MKLSRIATFFIPVLLLAGTTANAGIISVGSTGLSGTSNTEDFSSGTLGVDSTFSSSDFSVSTISGKGVTLTNNTNCNNSTIGVTGNYLYAGLNGLCNASPETTDSFSILFEDVVSELSWSGFSAANGVGYTVQALFEDNVVSSLLINNNFFSQFVTFTGSDFDEIRILENGTNGGFFGMDDFAWNWADQTPVPSPAPLALILFGLIGMSFNRYKTRA